MSLQDTLQAVKALKAKERYDALKKPFELYSEHVDVTGSELACLTILVNLVSKDAVELEDLRHAKHVLKSDEFWGKFSKVASQLHTHNLKWPDSRVNLKHHIRALPEIGVLPKFGWSGNSGDYRFGRLLTSTFIWQGLEHSLISVWLGDFVAWRKAAYKLGITKVFWYQIKRDLEDLFQESHFPDVVDSYSPELQFPYKDQYLTVTPVASHETQLAIQHVTGLPMHSLSFPHPSALGVLCGSLGGHVRLIRLSPLGNQNVQRSSLGSLSLKNYLNPYVLTAIPAINLYRRIVDVRTYSSLRLKRRARLNALNTLDGILAEWVAPLVQVKLSSNVDGRIDGLGAEEQEFVESSSVDIEEFSRYLNRKLHGVLELGKYSRKFSYHQRLVGVTQKRLASLLRRLLLAETQSESNNTTFIILKSLRINEANGLNNPYVVGMPSIIGLYGFLHRFECQLREIYADISVDSFALHCGEYSYHASNNLPAPSIPDKEMRIKRSGITPEFKFDGKFSIIVKLHCLTDNAVLDVEQIKAAVPERLWGGSVHPPYLYENTEWAAIAYGSADLKRYLIRNLFFGNWITPEGEDGLELRKHLEKLNGKNELSLCLVGYKLLEKVKPRSVVSGIHAFCEPVVDLCCLKQTHKVIKPTKSIEQELFWRYVPVTQNCTTLRVSPVCGETHAASQSAEL
ncbi:type I-F CRISPR-associated protein Csy2 [Maribrevibacterium harenarium]|nr:type I-F CRISPR-associated protein Csy2 [Maribrevibacterium harenarium]